MPDANVSLPPNRVKASPTKRFFIAVLIKDIQFLDAIVELVDNSVDSARSSNVLDNLAGKVVELNYDSTQFSIRDNAAGIGIAQAKENAFRFGRPDDAPATPGSLGEFGVGMKRALFKIGKHFEVESKTASEHFRVVVDTDEWEAEPEGNPDDWTFPMVMEGVNSNPSDTGTLITVKRLSDYSVEQLSNSNFGTQLMLELQQAHAESLNSGLTITVNNGSVAAEVEMLLFSEDIKPIRYSREIKVLGKDVKVSIIAGAGEASLAKAGWYVFCNGRQIERAEKTEITGWNTAIDADQKTPKAHWQFRRFRGYVFFESDSQDALPWNTTKTGLDVEAPAYRQVMADLFASMRQVINFLNQVDAELGLPEEGPLTAALNASQFVPLRQLPESFQFEFKSSPQKAEKRNMRISYQKDLEIGERVKEALGVTSNREVGERTFDYYVDSEGLR